MKRPLTLAIASALCVFALGCSQQPATLAGTPPPSEPDASDRRDVTAEAKVEDAERRQRSEPGRPAREAPHAGGARIAAEHAASTTGQAAMAPMPAAPVSDAAPALAFRSAPPPAPMAPARGEPANREHYAQVDANPVHRAAETPVSTFSIDVDSGSYANVRRMLASGSLPPADAVRAEEMINYFDYGYTPPQDLRQPFSVTTERSAAPWNAQRQLLLVGIKGFEVPRERIPASNLVFLIDTSGSMQAPDKIDLLKQAFIQMAETLRPQDRVSIVTYAGSAGLVLPSTPGSDPDTIIAALEQLYAGGSTNGGAGIELAYATAQQHFIEGGVNRVILATDGDFNVGTVDIEALKTLVAAKRETGIALTTLGFGTGNYNDALAEQLADIGNGNHAYIDTLSEARKVLVDELSSTMLTIAQDVKIQLEFNPAVVAEYRLIGYENRMLRREDFNNDRIDAGEIGAGHDVTALYELALVGSGGESVDPLRYAPGSVARDPGGELGFLRLRYKAPGAEASHLIERPIGLDEAAQAPSERLRFAAAVAAFAESLRGGTHLARWTLDDVAALARSARGSDPDGYRGEFIALVEQARALQPGPTPVAIAD